MASKASPARMLPAIVISEVGSKRLTLVHHRIRSTSSHCRLVRQRPPLARCSWGWVEWNLSDRPAKGQERPTYSSDMLTPLRQLQSRTEVRHRSPKKSKCSRFYRVELNRWEY